VEANKRGGSSAKNKKPKKKNRRKTQPNGAMREYIKNPCRHLSAPAFSGVCLEWKLQDLLLILLLLRVFFQ